MEILNEFNIRSRVYNKKKLIIELEETIKYLDKIPNIGKWDNLRQNFTYARDSQTINSIYEGLERVKRKLRKFLVRIKK